MLYVAQSLRCALERFDLSHLDGGANTGESEPDDGGRDVFVHFERLKTLDLNAPAFNLASHGR